MSDHKLFSFDDIDDGSARRVEIADRLVVVVRIGDSAYALGDTCSHEKVSLSEGYVDVDDCTIECWRHGASFDLVSGSPTSLPAVKPVPVYEVSVIDGDVWLSIDSASEEKS